MLKRQVIPGAMFDSLAAGRGGAMAGRFLAEAEFSKHMLLLRGVLDTAGQVAHQRVAEVRAAYLALAGLQANAASATAASAVIRHPAVGAWAARTIRAMLEEQSDADPHRLSGIAAAAALRAGTSYAGLLPADSGAVVVPSVGRALFPGLQAGSDAEISVAGRRAQIRAGADAVQVPAAPVRHTEDWDGIRQCVAVANGMRLRIRIDDVDPDRFAAYSDVAGRLSSAEADEWHAAIAEAWQLLTWRHRQVAAEVRSVISVLTPLAAAPGEVSATSRELFGAVGLSRPRDGRSLALTLAHEVQHAKLAAVLDLVTLVRPASKMLFYAPWRDDPRPPQALLHGSYAFLGVADFWRRQSELESGRKALLAQSEFARWRDAAQDAARQLLRCSDVTAVGMRFLDGMDRSLSGWRRHRITPRAGALARAAAARHRSAWQGANGHQVGGGSKSDSAR